LTLIDHEDLLLLQFTQQLDVELVELLLLSKGDQLDALQQNDRIHPQNLATFFSKTSHAPYVGNTHSKKFIPVVGKDPQKPEALQQRNSRIFGFLQHAGIERQPAQIPVEKWVRALRHKEI